MNGKQATILRDIARRMSSGTIHGLDRITHGVRSGIVTLNGTVKCTGYRATYRHLKRSFKNIPQPDRAQWLDELWNLTT